MYDSFHFLTKIWFTLNEKGTNFKGLVHVYFNFSSLVKITIFKKIHFHLKVSLLKRNSIKKYLLTK